MVGLCILREGYLVEDNEAVPLNDLLLLDVVLTKQAQAVRHVGSKMRAPNLNNRYNLISFIFNKGVLYLQ